MTIQGFSCGKENLGLKVGEYTIICPNFPQVCLLVGNEMHQDELTFAEALTSGKCFDASLDASLILSINFKTDPTTGIQIPATLKTVEEVSGLYRRLLLK